jgi:uncharacterized protein YndB with AHSA1/START domain
MDRPDHYFARVRYAAPIADAFRAAATPGGENGWWSTDGDVARGAGEDVRLNWSDTDYIVFRVEQYDAPYAMRWSCIKQHDQNLPDPDEWIGTTLVWRFEPVDDTTTDLAFAHEGLAPRLDCYDACERGWDFFLRSSIRSLAERGQGAPFRTVVTSPETTRV